MSRLNRILLIIVIILGIITAILWFFPDILSSLSKLNPFDGGEEAASTAISSTNVDENLINTTTNTGDVANAVEGNSPEEIEQELNPFEEEIRQRHESYQTKFFTYEPYQLAVNRNPFKVTSIAVDSEEKSADKQIEEISPKKSTELALNPKNFAMRELHLSGTVSLYDDFVAIIKIQEEYFVVNKNDLILGTYFVTEITENSVFIKFDNNEMLLTLKEDESK